MNKILVIALALGSTISSSPALARATNPSERQAYTDQYVERTSVSDAGDFCGPHQNGFCR